MLSRLVVGVVLTLCPTVAFSQTETKSDYVDAVVRGAGLMPWQEPGVSEEEKKFREHIEERKTRMLQNRDRVQHPALLSKEAIERIRRKRENDESVESWAQSSINFADLVIDKGEGYVEEMIPELTPTNPYGFTCPHCVGKQTQEGVGSRIVGWNHESPEEIFCRTCGQTYPDENYPESIELKAPRSGQTFTYFVNEKQRAHPENKTGELAYHWVGYPVHISFTGIVREKKILHMKRALNALAYAYLFTEEVKYAEKAKEVLLRFADCYPRWLYHDYWDTIADCDPMYAAWHDKSLPIEWKRHLCTNAYRKDTMEKAGMLQTYWGCGRIHPSTDGISGLDRICEAYDLVVTAKYPDGKPVWSEEEKAKVERDFILEYVIGGEPFVGGEGKADEENNKAPRVYNAQAAVAMCLGIPELADVAIRGYEIVRDNSFLYDGMSTESPSYTNMYLSQLIAVPEKLYGFEWPSDFEAREGVYDPYADDWRLELMYRAVLDQLDPEYHYLPLSDTHVGNGPSRHIIEYALKRYPQYFEGKYPALTGGVSPDLFAMFNLDTEELEKEEPFELPEIYFPAWMTSIFRHGEGEKRSVLSMMFNPEGGHRHQDNLALYYYANGTGVLGDQGYVGDMPINRWIRSTRSHNLVVVDDSDQLFYDNPPRVPKLNLLATSPKVSFVEAESKAYPQCSDYRRLVLLVKGPDSKTFSVDFFRVEGGDRHDYRLYSELASSDGTGELLFEGIEFPEEPPLPDVGSSLEEDDIFGLRDLRTVCPSNPNWRAVWKEGTRAIRFWNLSEADEVTASNGPGQRSRDEAGRRVRYLDVTRRAEGLKSLFVGVHEPSNPEGGFSITGVERLQVPEGAGPDAAAVRIESEWGVYTLLNEFENESEVGGLTFKGKLGVHCEPVEGEAWILASSAETFLSADGNLGFEKQSPSKAVSIESVDQTTAVLEDSIPGEFLNVPEGFQNYLLANDGEFETGFPIKSVSGNSLEMDRFQAPDLKIGLIPNLVFQGQQ